MYLTQALHRAVQQTPHLAATVFGERVRTWTQSGDRVAILAQNCDDYHDVLFAAPWADAVAVPVNTRWSAREIAFSLQDCGSVVLVVGDAFLDMVDELRVLAPSVQAYIHAGERATPDGAHGFEDLIGAHDPVEDARRGGDALAA